MLGDEPRNKWGVKDTGEEEDLVVEHKVEVLNGNTSRLLTLKSYLEKYLESFEILDLVVIRLDKGLEILVAEGKKMKRLDLEVLKRYLVMKLTYFYYNNINWSIF